MAGDDDADLRSWFRELVASDPGRRLQEFRNRHPGESIPPDLEFASRYEAILSDARIPSGEAYVGAIIEQQIREETHPGTSYRAAWHAPAFKRIDALVRDDGMTREAAITAVHRELETKAVHVARDSVRREYQRFERDCVVKQIAQAIVDNDPDVGVAALRELLSREQRDGRKKGRA